MNCMGTEKKRMRMTVIQLYNKRYTMRTCINVIQVNLDVGVEPWSFGSLYITGWPNSIYGSCDVNMGTRQLSLTVRGLS